MSKPWKKGLGYRSCLHQPNLPQTHPATKCFFCSMWISEQSHGMKGEAAGWCFIKLLSPVWGFWCNATLQFPCKRRWSRVLEAGLRLFAPSGVSVLACASAIGVLLLSVPLQPLAHDVELGVGSRSAGLSAFRSPRAVPRVTCFSRALLQAAEGKMLKRLMNHDFLKQHLLEHVNPEAQRLHPVISHTLSFPISSWTHSLCAPSRFCSRPAKCTVLFPPRPLLGRKHFVYLTGDRCEAGFPCR